MPRWLVMLVRRVLGYPSRRMLDRRVEWAINAVDDRLGSERDTRPGVHARLDDLENWSRQTLAALGHQAVRGPPLVPPRLIRASP